MTLISSQYKLSDLEADTDLYLKDVVDLGSFTIIPNSSSSTSYPTDETNDNIQKDIINYLNSQFSQLRFLNFCKDYSEKKQEKLLSEIDQWELIESEDQREDYDDENEAIKRESFCFVKREDEEIKQDTVNWPLKISLKEVLEGETSLIAQSSTFYSSTSSSSSSTSSIPTLPSSFLISSYNDHQPLTSDEYTKKLKQLKKDVERDRFLINSDLIIGSTASTDGLTSIKEKIKDNILKIFEEQGIYCPELITTSSISSSSSTSLLAPYSLSKNSLERLTLSILYKASRTHSGGIAYQALEKVLSGKITQSTKIYDKNIERKENLNENVNDNQFNKDNKKIKEKNYLLIPQSSVTPPLKIHILLNNFPMFYDNFSSEREGIIKQNEWGLVCRVISESLFYIKKIGENFDEDNNMKNDNLIDESTNSTTSTTNNDNNIVDSLLGKCVSVIYEDYVLLSLSSSPFSTTLNFNGDSYLLDDPLITASVILKPI